MSSAEFSTSSSGGSGSSMLGAATAMIPWLQNFTVIVLGLAAMVGGLLYVKQDSLLYYPVLDGIPKSPSENPPRYRSPDEYQVPFESHMIRCKDGVSIHAWLMLLHDAPQSKPDNKKRPTIIFFHGNAGNIGLRLPNAVQMMKRLDVNVLLVEYRGYGDSDDDATVNEAGLKLDAQAALEFIRTTTNTKQVDPNQIFIFGRSLGGSVAFHLALYAEQQEIPIAGVMVENTFLSISAMVDTLMPYVAPFKSLILRIGWNSEEIVPHVTSPVLYLAGAQDELVPHAQMLKLYQKTTASRFLRMHVIDNGTHNEAWLQGGTEYWAQMREFMMAASSSQQPANTPALPTLSSPVSKQDTPNTVGKMPGS